MDLLVNEKNKKTLENVLELFKKAIDLSNGIDSNDKILMFTRFPLIFKYKHTVETLLDDIWNKKKYPLNPILLHSLLKSIYFLKDSNKFESLFFINHQNFSPKSKILIENENKKKLTQVIDSMMLEITAIIENLYKELKTALKEWLKNDKNLFVRIVNAELILNNLQQFVEKNVYDDFKKSFLIQSMLPYLNKNLLQYINGDILLTPLSIQTVIDYLNTNEENSSLFIKLNVSTAKFEKIFVFSDVVTEKVKKEDEHCKEELRNFENIYKTILFILSNPDKSFTQIRSEFDLKQYVNQHCSYCNKVSEFRITGLELFYCGEKCLNAHWNYDDDDNH